jgi:hypothetical protein
LPMSSVARSGFGNQYGTAGLRKKLGYADFS